MLFAHISYSHVILKCKNQPGKKPAQGRRLPSPNPALTSGHSGGALGISPEDADGLSKCVHNRDVVFVSLVYTEGTPAPDTLAPCAWPWHLAWPQEATALNSAVPTGCVTRG